MVYKHRVGVDRTEGQVFHDNFVAILPESELPDGKPGPYTKAFLSSSFVAASNCLPWLKLVPTLVDRFQKGS
jgi:hypothetical protein